MSTNLKKQQHNTPAQGVKGLKSKSILGFVVTHTL